MKYHYALLDVFTETPFAGNPLAVFSDAGELDGAVMQRIANELNLSETVFITGAPEPGVFSIRIFTPRSEIPFAGHPTIGTAHWLRASERLGAGHRLVLREGIGDVVIGFEAQSTWLTTAQPLRIDPASFDAVTAAALLGLAEVEVIAAPVVASCGLDYWLIELGASEALARARLDVAAHDRLFEPWLEGALYLFCRQQGGARARMFAPRAGIPEDPATGSAAAPLAGWLAHREAAPGAYRYRIEQGVEMGRPSLIEARVERGTEGIERIEVGGRAVIVGGGWLAL
ncbi:PhzF family phenazine biosynthesis protein [Halotalea alkalilenta]|uniref:Phenazine biosynthesis protein PhzF n=1 Tax=Halotalea alkalilenta TaxID=376489 RepID=A0A172YIU7_9GAMM|nr:PhzF family phenazine biosynthesis protein [Halotalea alkalilenta]ANF59130.1 hypothetical protein A5892_18045 [Halotalea alkalilenta]